MYPDSPYPVQNRARRVWLSFDLMFPLWGYIISFITSLPEDHENWLHLFMKVAFSVYRLLLIVLMSRCAVLCVLCTSLQSWFSDNCTCRAILSRQMFLSYEQCYDKPSQRTLEWTPTAVNQQMFIVGINLGWLIEMNKLLKQALQ